jgi:hypothetical protein
MLQVLLQELHQEGDLRRWSANEILRRESIKRKRGKLDSGSGLYHMAYRFDTSLVSGDTGKMSPFGPAAIAIHDDGDMFRELAGIQLAEELSFFTIQPSGNGNAQTWPLNGATLAQQHRLAILQKARQSAEKNTVNALPTMVLQVLGRRRIQEGDQNQNITAEVAEERRGPRSSA